MSTKLHTLFISIMSTDHSHKVCKIIFWELFKKKLLWSWVAVYKIRLWQRNKNSVWFKNADIHKQAYSWISQYVRSEFVRTQQNMYVLLIKRLAYICLLMAAGVKWRCSNLQIKMYENISDSPISGLLWQ